MKAVILAAGRGTRLAPLTDDRPKPLVPVGGRPLLLRTLERLAEAGLRDRDVIVVAGYRDDVLRAVLADAGQDVTVIMNPRYADWQNFYSLLVAREAVGGDAVLQLDGDLLFETATLRRVLDAPGPAVLAVDVRPDLDEEPMKVAAGPDGVITAVSKLLPPEESLGEYVGMARLDAPLAAEVFDELAGFEREGLTHEYYDHAYHRLAARGRGPFRVADVHGLMCIEIDDAADLERAESQLDVA